MYYQITIYPEHRLVHFKHVLPFDIEDVYTGFQELFAHKDFVRGYNILRDYSAVEIGDNWDFSRLSTTATARMNEYHDRIAPCKIALLAKSQLDFARTQQASRVLDQRPEEVTRKGFVNVADALVWLGAPPRPLRLGFGP